MLNSGQYRRLLDKDIPPDDHLLAHTIGENAMELWRRLRDFLRAHYDFEPELDFYGLKYGWCYKYRRKKKTLCVLFPETGAFTVLVTLGKRETEEVERTMSSFNDETQRIFRDAYQYHDGKWVYRRVLSEDDLRDVLSLIRIKRKPKV